MFKTVQHRYPRDQAEYVLISTQIPAIILVDPKKFALFQTRFKIGNKINLMETNGVNRLIFTSSLTRVHNSQVTKLHSPMK